MKQTARSKQSISPCVLSRGLLLATPERARQQGGVVKDYFAEDPKSRVLMVRSKARCECKLDGYYLAGKIAKDEHAAGMKFRAAWLAKAEGIKTHDSTVESLGNGDGSSAIERMTMAERTLKEAFQALARSHQQSLVVVDVCGTNNPAGDGERIETLRRGLDTLARHWKIV